MAGVEQAPAAKLRLERRGSLVLARGRYQARLALQVEFLDAHPDVALVGAAYDLIDNNGVVRGSTATSADSLRTGWEVLFETPVAVSLAMFRTRVAVSRGGFDASLRAAAEYSLWERISSSHAIANLPMKLGAYRSVASGVATVRRCASWLPGACSGPPRAAAR